MKRQRLGRQRRMPRGWLGIPWSTCQLDPRAKREKQVSLYLRVDSDEKRWVWNEVIQKEKFLRLIRC
jgi:hypothetical protein